jgi:hypothetical protein
LKFDPPLSRGIGIQGWWKHQPFCFAQYLRPFAFDLVQHGARERPRFRGRVGELT